MKNEQEMKANQHQKIEKGIPIPPKPMHKKGFPIHQLEIGDSFFFSGKTVQFLGGYKHNWSKKTGFKFTCRTVEGGARIWRTA